MAAVTGRRSGAYRRVPRSISLPSRASSRGQRRDQQRMARRSPAPAPRSGRVRPVPRRQHLHRGAAPRRRTPRRRVRRAGAAAAHPSPGRSACRSPGRLRDRRRSCPLTCTPSLRQPGRPLLARRELHPRPHQPCLVSSAAARRPRRRCALRCSCRSDRSARRRRARGRRVGCAGTPSGSRRCPGSRASPAVRVCGPRRASVALLVVVPRLAGADPAALDPPHRAVDVEHLQHHLQPGPAEVDQRLQRRRRLRPVGLEGVESRCAPWLPTETPRRRSSARRPGPRGRAAGRPRRSSVDRPARPTCW